MDEKTKEFYLATWKHLADKYDSEGSSIEEIMNEKTVHTVLTRYFSHLSETEKQNLLNDLRQREAKAEIPVSYRI
ncbi:MAG: glycoside hydrolase family 5 protein [Prevotellaceae bacterium]|jgi:hypothetical protein|nr:glycoside hydrolase family 5 protein [Prevotellaceae bacterium]